MPSRVGERARLIDHLQELRFRLLSSLAVLLLGTLAGYFIHRQVLSVLLKPLNQPIFYTSPAGGFDFVLKLSFLFGFTVSIPVIALHTLRFLEPALPKHAIRKPLLIVLASILLLLTGMGFAYFVSLPAALYVLHAFTPENIQALISTDAYFSFVARYLMGFGLLFQLPLVMWLINAITPIPTKRLMAYQKWVILVSFILAAILTPTPDVFNQLVMAVPLIALYQVTVVLLWLRNRRKGMSS